MLTPKRFRNFSIVEVINQKILFDLVMTTMEGGLPENTMVVDGSQNIIEASSTGNKITNNIRNYLESFTEENEVNETSNVTTQENYGM